MAQKELEFDYQAFVRELATQADSLVPVDINQEDKQYVTNMVYNFCTLACDALVKEDNIPQEHTTLITQFIGEWTFHKSIDLIRAGISQQFRDSVLQQIAFVVFEISKQALSKNMPNEQVIQVVEHHVKKKYLEELENLKDKNLISPEEYDRAMGESNIDKMAESQEEMNEEFSTSKVLKLASFAMVLQKMPEQKAESILSKMPEKEAKLVRDYMKMENLSENADETIMKYLSELRTNLPIKKSKKILPPEKKETFVTKVNDSKINDIILKERDGIKKYVSAIRDKQSSDLPSHISGIVELYLAEKV